MLSHVLVASWYDVYQETPNCELVFHFPIFIGLYQHFKRSHVLSDLREIQMVAIIALEVFGTIEHLRVLLEEFDCLVSQPLGIWASAVCELVFGL